MMPHEQEDVVDFNAFMATIQAPIRQPEAKARGNSELIRSEAPDPDRICRDGERTEHLTRLAGMWTGRRYKLKQVIEHALRWNANNDPPLDEAKVLRTCESIFRGNEAKRDETDAVALTPLFDLESAGVTRFLMNDAPPRRWLFKDCLPVGKSGAVVAPGGTGKSMLMLQMAVAVATGEDFLSWQVGESGTVLALFAEDDDDEIHRRLRTVVDTHAARGTAEFHQRLTENLKIKTMVAERNLMTSAGRTGEVEQTDYIERLLLAVESVDDLKLIIIDPASRFRGGDENSAQDSTRFVEAIERLATSTGATVLIVHHTRKGAGTGSNQEASRGSSAFTDGVRWQMNLNTFNEKDAGEHGIDRDKARMYLEASITKNNYAAPQASIHLIRGDGGVLHTTELVSKKARTSESVSGKIIEIVRADAAKGTHYSKTAFEQRFGGKDGPLKIGVLSLRAALNALVQNGGLINEKQMLSLPPPIPKAKLAMSGYITTAASIG